MQRDQRQAALVDLDIHLIHQLFALIDRRHRMRVALDDGFDRIGDHDFRQGAHLYETAFQFLQLFIEMSFHGVRLIRTCH